MGSTDDGETRIAQPLGIAPLLGVGEGIAYVGKVLMAVGTYQLVVAASVEVEAGLATLGIVGTYERERADADTGDASIEGGPAVEDAGG